MVHVCPHSCIWTFDNLFRRLLHNPDIIFGPCAVVMTVTLLEDYRGFLLAVLPPETTLGRPVTHMLSRATATFNRFIASWE